MGKSNVLKNYLKYPHIEENDQGVEKKRLICKIMPDAIFPLRLSRFFQYFVIQGDATLHVVRCSYFSYDFPGIFHPSPTDQPPWRFRYNPMNTYILKLPFHKEPSVISDPQRIYRIINRSRITVVFNSQ